MAAISGPVRYAAANAGIRAGLAQLLSSRQWQRLLAAADPSQFAGRLGSTPYAQAISSAGNEPLESSRLERALRTHLAQAARRPVKFLQGRPRALLEWRWRRFELDNLKILLRMIAAKLPPRQIRRSLVPLGEGSRLSCMSWREPAQFRPWWRS